MRTKGKVINFCESCPYSEEGEFGDNEAGKCPKCGTWMWTIYEYIYDKKSENIGSEAGLTDNDEVSFHGDKLSRLNRIWNKGLKKFKEFERR